MNFFNKIKSIFVNSPSPPTRIRLKIENIEDWTSYSQLLTEGKVKFDNLGRLRYLHGAPVGDLVLIRTNKDGTLKYKELAEEWFDPESEIAKNFKWDN